MFLIYKRCVCVFYAGTGDWQPWLPQMASACICSPSQPVQGAPRPCCACSTRCALATGKPVIYDTVDLHFLREARTAMGEQMSAPEATRRAQVRVGSRVCCRVAPEAQAGEGWFEVAGLRWAIG